MNEKRVSRTGWLYLVIMELFIVANIVRSLVGERGEMNIFLNALTSQMMMILPVVIYYFISQDGFKETFSLRMVRIPTLLLTVLYVILWYPLIAACNAFTMLFTENTAMAMQQDLKDASPLVVWLVVGVAGPLLEELSFRGAILSGLRKSGRIFAAVLLQAVMFGVLHLNLNQMAYAIVLGFAFGLAVSATGSIWCGFLGHMMVNSASVAAMTAMSRMPGNMMQQSMDLAESPFWKTQLLAVLPLLAFVGIAAAGLSILLLRAMAYTEGREREFR
ncbi:MAG: CPBP family intramembrane metalloprotease, partial [Lachnospiraceae bacterium]|nr:CPBP family intramembrane metalloprotease [Lachnospiraceae bacterium]